MYVLLLFYNDLIMYLCIFQGSGMRGLCIAIYGAQLYNPTRRAVMGMALFSKELAMSKFSVAFERFVTVSTTLLIVVGYVISTAQLFGAQAQML
jgi:hypothetical protein